MVVVMLFEGTKVRYTTCSVATPNCTWSTTHLLVHVPTQTTGATPSFDYPPQYQLCSTDLTYSKTFARRVQRFSSDHAIGHVNFLPIPQATKLATTWTCFSSVYLDVYTTVSQHVHFVNPKCVVPIATSLPYVANCSPTTERPVHPCSKNGTW